MTSGATPSIYSLTPSSGNHSTSKHISTLHQLTATSSTIYIQEPNINDNGASENDLQTCLHFYSIIDFFFNWPLFMERGGDGDGDRMPYCQLS